MEGDSAPMEHEEQGDEDKRHQEHDGDQEGSQAEDMAGEEEQDNQSPETKKKRHLSRG